MVATFVLGGCYCSGALGFFDRDIAIVPLFTLDLFALASFFFGQGRALAVLWVPIFLA